MNATVSLPISELDNLRDIIKDLSSKCAEYQKNEKQIKLTLLNKTWSYEPFSDTWGRVKYVNKDKTVESHQYINLEDVIDALKYEQEQLVSDKLYKLEAEIKSLKEKNSKQYSDFIDQSDILRKKYEEDLKKKESEIKVLKGELVDLDKDTQIINLKDQLDSLTKQLNSKPSIKDKISYLLK